MQILGHIRRDNFHNARFFNRPKGRGGSRGGVQGVGTHPLCDDLRLFKIGSSLPKRKKHGTRFKSFLSGAPLS